MARSLDEINAAFSKEYQLNCGENVKPKNKMARRLSNIAFYGTLVLLLLVVFTYTQAGASRSIFGYSYYNILTSSMQSTIPQGSFILVKETPGEELQVGDDITYLSNPTTTVTHRIVGIIENYENTGQRAFLTQGIMNPAPDKLPVPAANVVGKVVFHSYRLGVVFNFIKKHHISIILCAFLFVGLFTVIKKLMRIDRNTYNEHTQIT